MGSVGGVPMYYSRLGDVKKIGSSNWNFEGSHLMTNGGVGVP